MNHAQIFEAITLICFGVAWPMADWRMVRNRRAEGSGLALTGIIFAGYVCGAVGKWVTGAHGPGPIGWPTPVFWLYAANAASVGANMALQWRYRAPRWSRVRAASV